MKMSFSTFNSENDVVVKTEQFDDKERIFIQIKEDVKDKISSSGQ